MPDARFAAPRALRVGRMGHFQPGARIGDRLFRGGYLF